MVKPTKLQLLAMGERLRARREQLGKTQPETAQDLSDIVWERHRKRVAIAGDKVSKWERGECRPIPLYREAYRVYYNASDEDLGFRGATRAAPLASIGAAAPPQLDLFLLEPLDATLRPVDEGYVGSVRDTVSALVTLDNLFGGDDLSALAVRAFRAAYRRLGAGRYEAGIDLDLQAATGELAEVAAWMLYDADNQAAARQLNQEALLLSRLSGDRAMELLILQNMSMQAGCLGRPQEALQLVTVVLDTSRLSPRVQALFTIREARARAQLGEHTDAPRAFAKARSLFQDGVADTDPAWVWWVTERELAWHEAMCLAGLGDWRRAVELFRQAAEGCPVDLNRTRYNDLAHLLLALVEVGAWRETEPVITQTLPYVGEVGSRRTAVLLMGAGKRIVNASASPPSTRDAAIHLLELLKTAGYESNTKDQID